VFTGGLNGVIKQFQPETGAISTIGQHLGNGSDNKVACSCLQTWKSNPNIVFSAGWDARFHVWDIRMSNSSSSNSKPSAVTTINLPAKAFAMDATISNDTNDKNDNYNSCTVAIATANRRVCILDLRAAAESDSAIIKASIAQDRESSLKYQTRTISFFPNGTGFALGSIEGRVAIEYLKEAEAEQGTSYIMILYSH
jgi:WD40 repeat protein